MARKAEQARSSNSFDQDLVRGFVDKIEGFIADLESERGTYMARCKAIRVSMKDTYGDAKDAGIPQRELKAVIKRRGLGKRIEKIRDELEADQAQTYSMLLEALGEFADTPLGQAALASKKKRGGRARGQDAAAEGAEASEAVH